MPYRITFSPEADDHLASLRGHERAKLLNGIERRLVHEPKADTRHCKEMRPNPIAQRRLRVGHLRVYYDVQEVPAPLVLVKAIGIKVRDRVYVGGREIKL